MQHTAALRSFLLVLGFLSGAFSFGSAAAQEVSNRKGSAMAPSETPPKRYSKPDDATLRKKLTPMQYKVTQKDGTEKPFANDYWDNKREGLYVDIVSGEPLFSSRHKYKSGTGWPSFWQPIEGKYIVEKEDRKLFVKRTEVRSKFGDSHLGHVFDDGPDPTGLRYCINSASLRFVPVEDLEKEGYSAYREHFTGAATAAGVAGAQEALAKATFGAGCFWCLEADMDKIKGVHETISGYTGGASVNPSYEQVSAGGSGHVEVVQVTYDPKVVSYDQLLTAFWLNTDPTVKDRQFCDSGSQYRSEIFAHDEAQEKAAGASRDALVKEGRFKVHTQVSRLKTFYPAEDYHQDYYRKNKVRYKFYRLSCGRDARLQEIWGPSRQSKLEALH